MRLAGNVMRQWDCADWLEAICTYRGPQFIGQLQFGNGERASHRAKEVGNVDSVEERQKEMMREERKIYM